MTPDRFAYSVAKAIVGLWHVMSPAGQRGDYGEEALYEKTGLDDKEREFPATLCGPVHLADSGVLPVSHTDIGPRHHGVPAIGEMFRRGEEYESRCGLADCFPPLLTTYAHKHAPCEWFSDATEIVPVSLPLSDRPARARTLQPMTLAVRGAGHDERSTSSGFVCCGRYQGCRIPSTSNFRSHRTHHTPRLSAATGRLGVLFTSHTFHNGSSEMIDNTHPSRTERGTMKVRQMSTGLVFERQPPDAHDVVATGAFEFADRDMPSIAEILRARTREDLVALCTDAGRPARLNDPLEFIVANLVQLIEAGTVTLV